MNGEPAERIKGTEGELLELDGVMFGDVLTLSPAPEHVVVGILPEGSVVVRRVRNGKPWGERFTVDITTAKGGLPDGGPVRNLYDRTRA